MFSSAQSRHDDSMSSILTGSAPDSRATLRRLALGAVSLGSILVVGYSVAIVGSGFRLLPGEVAANGVPQLVWVHVVLSTAALLLMPLQLSTRVRERHSRIHRVSGRTYVVCAISGGIFGALAAITTANGLIAGVGFFTLAVAWVGSTVATIVCARAGSINAHRKWAIRSASLVFAGVTLRLELGLGVALTGASFAVVYSVAAWLCWIPNLAVAEWLHRRRRDYPFGNRPVTSSFA